MTPNRRRRFVISKLQKRLIYTNFAYGLALVGVLAAVVFVPLVLQMNDDSLAPRQRERVAVQLLALHRHLWPGVAVVGMLFVAHSVRVTHRLLGPLYRFTQTMRQMARGDLSMRVRIRRHDFLHEEARVFNEMLEALRERVEGIDHEADRLGDELRRARASGRPTAAEPDLARLGEGLETLRAAIRRLHTGREQGGPPAMPAPALPKGPAEKRAPSIESAGREAGA